MSGGKDATVKTVQVTSRGLHRVTATETIGGVICRITLERDRAGRYQEISCTPLANSSGYAASGG